MFKISTTPLEKIPVKENLRLQGAGAFCSFEGLVRDHHEGKKVIGLEYEAYAPLCEQEVEKIFKEARKNFDIVDVQAFHRVGRLSVGELAVWIGVTAAHRDPAFQACRFVIDEVKARLPIWKKEIYENGDSAWVNCAACRSTAETSSHLFQERNSSSPTSPSGGSIDPCIEISRFSFQELMRYQFIDVREEDERLLHPIKKIPSQHFPMSHSPGSNLNLDPTQRYIIFCAKGKRSLSVTKELRSKGFQNVFSLKNGIEDFKTYFAR